MQRRGATVGHQRPARGRAPPLDGVHSGGVGHVLVHHLADGEGGERLRKVQRRPDGAGERRGRAFGRNADRAPGEARRVQPPEHQIRIRYRRTLAAAIVTSGSRLGAGALGPHCHAPKRVHVGDGAAAGADLDHLDRGDAKRQAAPLQEPVDPAHFEGARGQGLGVVDQADLGGGAAHVEREHALEPTFGGDLAGQDRASGGSRFDEADRKAHRGSRASPVRPTTSSAGTAP